MTIPTREEALAHFGLTLTHHGVKGMKWGVRKKSVTSQEVQDAGFRQQTRLNKFMDAKGAASDPTASSKSRAAAAKRAKTLEKEFDTSEDRVTAVRLSRGEKAALLILGGPIGAAVIIGNKIGAASVARDVDKARKAG